MKIGDLFFGMKPDDAGFEAEIVAKAEKAGDEAGKTLGERIGNGLKTSVKVGLVGLGAVVATALGFGIKGLMDLDNAMADFRAETGATEEEVKSASDAVLQFSKRNLQPIKEIAGTMAALRTEMGATQEQAEDLTEPFLKFAEVTGQTGPDAVKSFDNILDAWNLTAEDSGGIMDQLIASHQKYGGSVVANQEALADLAPALLAANLTLDDGIGLLNLFASAGLDSAVAVVAFQKALTKVDSPEELQRLIDDIIATEDPFLRAQKAADLFGAKAGAKLANALRPGMDALESYHISQEEAIGSAQRAAEAFEGTFGRQAQLWINNIKGMAIGLVQNLGPGLLGVVASFATIASGLPNLRKGLVPVLDLMKKAGTSIVPGVFRALGALSDSIPALIVRLKALGLAGGLAAGGIIAIGVAVGSMNADIIKTQGQLIIRAKELGVSWDEVQRHVKVLTDAGMDVNVALERVVAGMEAAAEVARNKGSSMSEAWAEAWQKVTVVTAEGGQLVAATADGIPIEVADALEAGAGTVGTAAGTAWSPIHDEIVKARQKAVAEAFKMPAEIAQAIIDGRDEVVVAGTLLANAATDPLMNEQRIAEAREKIKELAHMTAEEIEAATPASALARQIELEKLDVMLAAYLLRADPKSKEAAGLLAKYFKSEDPATQLALETMMGAAEYRTYVMANEIEAEAARAGIAPEEAFRRHKVAAATEAALLAAGVRNRMRQEMDGIGADGEEDGAEWAAGVAAGILKNYYLVEGAGAAVRNLLDQAGAPPAPGKPAPAPAKPAPAPAPTKPAPGPVYKQPLPEFAQGAWDVPRNMFAGLHRGEMVVPSALATFWRRLAGAMPAMQGATAGSTTINNYLNIEGERPVVSTATEIAEQAARLGRFRG